MISTKQWKFKLLSGTEVNVDNLQTAWRELTINLNIYGTGTFIKLVKNDKIVKWHNLLDNKTEFQDCNIIIYYRTENQINLINDVLEDLTDYQKIMAINIFNYIQYTGEIWDFETHINNREDIENFFKNMMDNLIFPNYTTIIGNMNMLKRIDNLIFNFDQFTDNTKFLINYINPYMNPCVNLSFVGLFTCEIEDDSEPDIIFDYIN
jgi:hypothetical protein